MTRATLTARDLAGARVVTVDCRHGETSVAYVNGRTPDAVQLTDAIAATVALLKHHSEERCRCTLDLRQRYGVAA